MLSHNSERQWHGKFMVRARFCHWGRRLCWCCRIQTIPGTVLRRWRSGPSQQTAARRGGRWTTPEQDTAELCSWQPRGEIELCRDKSDRLISSPISALWIICESVARLKSHIKQSLNSPLTVGGKFAQPHLPGVGAFRFNAEHLNLARRDNKTPLFAGQFKGCWTSDSPDWYPQLICEFVNQTLFLQAKQDASKLDIWNARSSGEPCTARTTMQAHFRHRRGWRIQALRN